MCTFLIKPWYNPLIMTEIRKFKLDRLKQMLFDIDLELGHIHLAEKEDILCQINKNKEYNYNNINK